MIERQRGHASPIAGGASRPDRSGRDFFLIAMKQPRLIPAVRLRASEGWTRFYPAVPAEQLAPAPNPLVVQAPSVAVVPELVQ